MKICLDTNFIWGWFENAIKAYRINPEDYETGKFDPTKKMMFLTAAKSELLTTNVAKSEVFRKLYTEYSVAGELCKRTWEDFVNRFSINVLKVKEIDFDEVAELCLVTQLKRGSIPNLIQLQFNKKANLPFATGDETIKDNYLHYYGKVYTYIDLRKLFGALKSQQSS